MLPFDSIWRAWVQVSIPSSLSVVQVPAKPNPRTSGDFLWLEFQQTPYGSAIKQGFCWEEGRSFTGTFESTLSTTTGTLKPASPGYSIDQSDLDTAFFTSYYLPTPDSTDPASIAVVPEINGNTQIKIMGNNRIVASPDLIGKTIKVQAVYPSPVVLSSKKIGALTVHLIGQASPGGSLYMEISNCTIEETGTPAKIRLGQITRVEQC